MLDNVIKGSVGALLAGFVGWIIAIAITGSAGPGPVIETLIGGLLVGVLYSLVALGVVLIFKASGVFNYAQGAMVLFAALAVARLSERMPLPLAILLAIGIMVALAYAIDISHPSGYKRVTGTSIAAPQVAGAAALYIVKHGRVGPGTVRAGLISEGEPSALSGDPDGIAEPIVNVASPDFEPPTVAITAPLPNARVKAGAAIKLTATDIGGWGVKSVEVRYCKGALCDFPTAKPIGIATQAPYVVKWKKPPKPGTYTLVAMATDKAGNVRISAPVTVRVKK